MTKTIDIGTQRPEEVKSFLSQDRPILMLYRMNMCPHCVALQPTWKDVEKRLARESRITLAEVEYQNMGNLPAYFRNIRGFPTIQVIQNGKIRDEYFGDRNVDSILSFARSFMAPVSEATSAATTKKASTQKPTKKAASPATRSKKKPSKASA